MCNRSLSCFYGGINGAHNTFFEAPSPKPPLKMNTQDTDYNRLRERASKQKRLEDELKKRRDDALGVVHRILKGCQDSYSLQHTGLTRLELLRYLDLNENGKLPLGYSIDHIKERRKHSTDKELQLINHYLNLRLLSQIDNQARNWLK